MKYLKKKGRFDLLKVLYGVTVKLLVLLLFGYEHVHVNVYIFELYILYYLMYLLLILKHDTDTYMCIAELYKYSDAKSTVQFRVISN